MGKFVAALLLAACLLSEAGAAAPPLSLATGEAHYALNAYIDVLEDQDGRLRIEDVARADAPFGPAATQGEDIRYGYTGAVYWFRFTVQGGTRGGPWLLDIGYPRIDEVTLYAPRGDGSYNVMQAGDSVLADARPAAHRSQVFVLRPASDVETYYLRIRTEGMISMPATLWTVEAFLGQDQFVTVLVGAYFGLLLALLFYNLLLYAMVRERICLLFACFCFCLFAAQASLHGIGALMLWPASPHWSNPALVYGMAGAGIFSMLFTRELLALRRRVPVFERVINGSIIAYGLCAAIMVVGSYKQAVLLLSLVGVVTPWAAMAVVFYCLKKGYTQDKFVIVAWTVLEIGTATYAARSIGFLPPNAFTNHALELTSAIHLFVFALALAKRVNRIRAERAAAQSEALAAERELVAALKRSEAELESKVRERTEELAEANRRLREKERVLIYQSQHDALTGLLNRHALNDRINHALTQRRRDGKALALLMLDLDNFKPINDAHGHDAGDAALVEVARRLRECVRESDTVARYGGDEFVIALETLNDTAEAVGIAEDILQSLALPFSYRGTMLTVNASIGIARYPDDGETVEALLINADAAMYRAKQRGAPQYEVASAKPRFLDNLPDCP